MVGMLQNRALLLVLPMAVAAAPQAAAMIALAAAKGTRSALEQCLLLQTVTLSCPTLLEIPPLHRRHRLLQ